MASVMNEFLINDALTADYTSSTFVTEGKQINFAATLVATAVNAATTLDVKIYHSPDNSTWFTLVDFADLVGVAGSEYVSITSNVLPYVKAVATLTGATKAATVKCTLWFDKG